MEKIVNTLIMALFVALSFLHLIQATTLIVESKMGTSIAAIDIVQIVLHILIAVLAMVIAIIRVRKN